MFPTKSSYFVTLFRTGQNKIVLLLLLEVHLHCDTLPHFGQQLKMVIICCPTVSVGQEFGSCFLGWP
jgi:hypothetical protein